MAGKADLINSIVDPLADLATFVVVAEPFGAFVDAAVPPSETSSTIDPNGGRGG
ncbi:MAG TPA: hypothetical protein VFJ16_05275 [Longimicrobium sp.]|nr:hypothetical protein [Longimicrobium sp.]